MSLPMGVVAVAGHSMEPSLRDGDVLIHARLAPREGDLVVARDTRAPRLVVKRVLAVGREEVLVGSDAPGHECLFLRRSDLIGRVVLRWRRPRAWIGTSALREAPPA